MSFNLVICLWADEYTPAIQIKALFTHFLMSSNNYTTSHVCDVLSHLVTSDCTIPWTVACQAPLSMEFSRQEY